MDFGPIGEHAAAAVKVLRDKRNLTFAELSRKLDDLGRPIPPLGLRRIEAGDRRIDVDDLVALALALEVSPLALLLPGVASDTPAAVVPGGDEYGPARIWEWGIGKWPLSGDEVTFVRDSHPARWAKMMAARDTGDETTLKLSAHTIQHSIEGEVQSGLRAAADVELEGE